MAITTSLTQDNPLVKKFLSLRQERDALQTRVVQAQANVEAARSRYNSIMLELKQFSISSVEELVAKIKELEEEITKELVSAESLMNKAKEAEREIDSEKSSSTIDG